MGIAINELTCSRSSYSDINITAQITASVATIAANGAPGQTITLTTDRFSYTGGPGNDTFVAGLNAAGIQTLVAQDSIDGAGGSNTLIATLKGSVTPAQIRNVQTVEASFIDGVGTTLNLQGSTGVTTFKNNGSSVAATLSSVTTSTAIQSLNTGSDLTVLFSGVSGSSDTASLTLSGVTGGTVTMAGIETVNLTSSGSATNTLAALAAANATTLNVGGTAGLTITATPLANVTTVAQAVGGPLSGALTLTFAQGAVTATGGAGNDTFTVNAAGNASLAGGLGNDTFVFVAGAFNANDTVSGGDGTSDTLRVAAADAATANANISGIENLQISTALGAALNTTAITSGITNITLMAGTAGVSAITGPAGTLSVNLGTSTTAGVLGGAFTVNDTGVATTDVLNLSNSNAASNAFAGAAITSAGYETVNLNTGSGSTAQVAGDITVTPDGTGTGVLNISGSNGITTGAINATTISASGLTGTAALVMGVGTVNATSITGTANADTLIASAAGTSITAGAGNDIVTGDAGNDVLLAGDGNDIITTGAGNDSVDGGAGNNRILLAANLTAADTIDGGAGGTNTAVITAAIGTAAIGARLSNIQTLETSAAAQDMSVFGNTTITTIAESGAALAVTNAGANLNTFNVLDAAPDVINSSFRRATDTSTNALTINAGGTIGATSTFRADDEETITINAANFAVDLDLTNAIDLTTLNITASGNDARALVIDALGATNLASATFSGINSLSTVNLNAVASNANLTATIGTFAATVTSGTGADSLTGGALNDRLEGNNGADTLSGGGGNDTLVGGQGVDQLNDGTGADDLTAGTGADVVNLTSDTTADTIRQGNADSLASTAANLTAGAIAAGDTITYANGIDLINGFLAGATNGDVLVVDFTVAQSILGQNAAALTTSGYLSGNYNATTGVFTVTANGSGADTMIVQIGAGGVQAALTTNTTAVILRGVNSANLVNSNFGGANSTSIVPLYNAGTNTFSFQANSFATERIFIAQNGTITPAAGVAPNPATGYPLNGAAVVTVNLTNLLGGNGVTINLDGVVQTNLAAVTGTTGNDTFIFADGSDFGSAAGANAINGGGGTDTLQITAFTGAQANVGTGAANGAALTGIANIVLTNGTTNGAGGGAQNLTITGANNYAITNSGGGAATLLGLGTGATTSYTSTAANVVDTVTITAAGQTVNVGAGNDTVNATVATAQRSTITMGDGAGDTLAITDAGISTFTTGARAQATDTVIQGVETITLTGASTLNLTKDAAIAITAANAATTLNVSGAGNATVTNTTGANLLTLAGTSNFVIDTVLTGGLTSTATGTVAVTALGDATQTITAASATAINAGTLGAASAKTLTIDGTGNFTVTALPANNNVTINLAATHTGTTAITTGANAFTLGTLAGNGATTVDATTLAGQLTIGANSTGAFTVNNLIANGGNVVFNTITNTASATVNGTDALAHTVTTGAGNDTVTITNVAGDGVQTVSTNAGNDTINLTGTTGANVILGGAGNDTLTGGTAVDNFRYATTATAVGAAGANVDRITNLLTGADTIGFASAANAVFNGLTLTAGNQGAVALANVTSAVVVNSIGDVYNTMTALLTAGNGFVASANLALVNQIVTFSNGTFAGSYLVVNDGNDGFQQATDFVANVTGINGGAAAWAGGASLQAY